MSELKTLQKIIDRAAKTKKTGSLVLTRKLDEAVIVEGGPILISVVRLTKGQVRLRFSGTGSIDRAEKQGK